MLSTRDAINSQKLPKRKKTASTTFPIVSPLAIARRYIQSKILIKVDVDETPQISREFGTSKAKHAPTQKNTANDIGNSNSALPSVFMPLDLR